MYFINNLTSLLMTSSVGVSSTDDKSLKRSRIISTNVFSAKHLNNSNNERECRNNKLHTIMILTCTCI